jgi:DNA segregation ATPase FtsK/SpoIIIE-like protein
MFGAFHIVSIILSILVGVVLCVLWKRGIIKNVRNVLLVTAIIVLVLEIYKQINYSFGYEDGISFYYQWYAFPWQFCSTPLYIGIIAGLTKGKVHNFLCSYLATFALFAGAAVMVYPADVFIRTLGIDIQTMVCHGSMVSIAIFLYYTNHVDTSWNTLLKAVPVFSITLSVAVILNELAHLVGITQEHTFNMFFVSRHQPSTLPVYSLVHNALMDINPAFYPLCLMLYIVGFTVCAGIMLLLARGIEYVATMDYDAQYAEMDARRREKLEERQQRLQILEEERKQKLAEDRERKKLEKEEKREQKELEKDEKRTEKQREQARRRRENKKRKKAESERKKEERKIEREKEKKRKEKQREEEQKIQKRLKEIEKREKEREKQLKKAQKEEEKRLKEEEKAYKKWQKEQENLGNYDPDIDDFYDEYYD